MNLFSLMASLTIDTSDYDKGLKDSKAKAMSFSSTFKSGMSKLGSAVKTTVKGIAVGMATASAAVVAVGKKALDAYADYEQLIGGVETLFKDSANIVQGYAANAYKTAGLSANEYMETVTGFSASLLQSLNGDTEKAAKKADMAITDMADNANKMGTSIESIQTAYQGFAKQNYTMLDNLKLGYGGTKEEMERLLEDATKLSGIEYDVSSYADIVDAIHVVQTEMGITGTTAKEASTTISGSIASAKSAWQNLITGLADDNADLDKLINNFFDSIVTVGENILPRISIILNGVTSLVSKLVPKIVAEIPKLFKTLLPQVVKGAKSILTAVTSVLPDVAKSIIGVLPDFISAVQEIFDGIVDALPSLLETIMTALPSLIPQIVTSITEMVVFLMQHIDEMLKPIINALPGTIVAIVSALMDSLPSLIDGMVSLVLGIVDALPDIIKSLIDALPTVIEKIIAGLNAVLPKLIDGVVQLVASLVEHLPEIIKSLIDAIPDIIKAIFDPKDGLLNAENIRKFVNGTIDVVLTLVEHLPEIITSLIEAIPTIIDAIFDPVDGFLSPENIGELVNGAIDVIMAIVTNLPTIIIGLVNALPNIIKRIFSTKDGLLSEARINQFINGGIGLVAEIVKNIDKIIVGLLNAIPKICESIVSGFGGLVNDFFNLGIDTGNAFLDGIASIAIAGLRLLPGYGTMADTLEREIHRITGRNGRNSSGWLGGFINDTAQQYYGAQRRHADGGVFTSPQWGMIGEDGAEAVVPLEKHTEWIQKVAKELNGFINNTPSISLTINHPVVREEEDIDKIANAVSETLADRILRSGMSWGGSYA